MERKRKKDLSEKTNLKEEFIEDLHRVFITLDVADKGEIHIDDLVSGLASMGLCHDMETIQKMLEDFERNKKEYLDFEEFVMFVSKREDEIRVIFDEIDLDKNGFLDFREIAFALKKIGMNYTTEDILIFIANLDKNKDQKISFNEFRSFVKILPSVNIKAIWKTSLVNSGIDIGEMPVGTDNNKLSSWKILLSGAIAGIVSRTLTAPIDRLKVLYQSGLSNFFITRTETAQKLIHSTHPSMLTLSRAILREQGLTAFFKGNGINVIKVGPESALNFFAYERLKKIICLDPNSPLNSEKFLAGAGAGVFSQICIYPLEIVKTRFAVSKDWNNRIIRCIADIWKEKGVRGLYKGINASIFGVIPYSGVNLAAFYTFREYYTAKNPQKKPSNLVILLAGAISSISAQIIAFPFQCIRTRLQADGANPSFGAPRYAGLIDCYKKVRQSEGIKGFYRGMSPNLLKAVPAISFSYLIYENMRRKLKID